MTKERSMICIILVKKKSGISNKRYGIKLQGPEYSNQMKLVVKKNWTVSL